MQLLGRRLLKEARVLEPFERLPLAFYYTTQREGGPLDYDALLELLKRKAGSDKEIIYRFLLGRKAILYLRFRIKSCNRVTAKRF